MHVTFQNMRFIPGYGRRSAWFSLVRWALAVMIVCTAAAFYPSVAIGAEPEIVARINGKPLLRKELQRLLDDPLAVQRLRQELETQNPENEEQELKRLAVQELVRRQLFLQEAERRDFAVGDKELNEALTALRSRFQDLTEFGVWMKERGLDDKSLFDTVRAQVLMTKVWTALVEDVGVTGEQIKEYYENRKEDVIIGEEVRLRIIAVGDEAKAEEILTALRAGASFDRLARRHSRGKLADRGGDTGWVDAGALNPMLQEAVGKLRVGDVGGPLEKSSDEFLLVGLQDRRPRRAGNLAEARPEIERRLLSAVQRDAVEAWLTKERKKAKIEVYLPFN